MKSYKIVCKDNRGNFNAQALADSVGGTWYASVSRYNGENDLFFLDVPDEFQGEFLELVSDDDNIVLWTEV